MSLSSRVDDRMPMRTGVYRSESRATTVVDRDYTSSVCPYTLSPQRLHL